jgi:tetratricopeptide (TPR) repeat protein
VLIFRLSFVAILVLLNGCADSLEKPDKPEKVAPVKITDSKEKARQKEAKADINPDVMFMLLIAEIASQREQYDVAMEGYMEAAKRSNDPRYAERAAVIGMYMKDSPRTQEAVSLWLKHDSKNLTARKIATLSALRADNKPVAIENLTELLKADPDGFENTLLELGGVMQKEGKVDIIYDTLTTLAEKQPNQAAIYFAQSLLAVQVKNGAVAEQQIQKVLKLKPDWDKAIILQAQIALLSGDMNKAKTIVKDASVKYPENDKIKKLFAQLLIKAENYKDASELYQQLVAADSKDTESEFTLALIYMQLDQDEQAEEIFKKLLDQPEWKSQGSFYLGKLDEKHGNIEKAVVWFDKVNEGDFAFESAVESISLLAKNKRFDAANKRVDALADKFPAQKNRVVLIQAEVYSQQKNYQKSFDILTKALDEQPEQQEFLYTRALIAEHLNRLDSLEKDLKKILVKEPDNVEALNALGYSLLVDPKRYGEAERYLQKAFKLRPDEAVIIDSYGWLQFKLGHPKEALDYLQRAYAKQKENEIAAHIAEVLWGLDRKDEARKLFDEAFKNAPEDEYLLEFQRRILNKAK